MIIKQSTINMIAGIAFLTVSLLLGGSVYFLNNAIHEQENAIARQAQFKQLLVYLKKTGQRNQKSSTTDDVDKRIKNPII